MDLYRPRVLSQTFRNCRESENFLDEKYFFSHALCGYYDCMWDGMNESVGHLIYRLSDLIDELKRRQMGIYPSATGSLWLDGNMWNSLEDWRKIWEKDFPKGIPEVFHLLLCFEDGAELTIEEDGLSAMSDESGVEYIDI